MMKKLEKVRKNRLLVMSKGDKCINIGINILLHIPGKGPKETAKGVGACLWGQPGWEEEVGRPLCTVTFFLLF